MAKPSFFIFSTMKGKKVLVGITGSIACIKSTQLIRLLTKMGCEVKVIMTKSAMEFISPITFASLSGNPVYSDFTENRETGEWTNHVHLGLWADAIIIAPCTANTLAKLISGQCDHFLMAVVMSARCPLFVAPAMDHDMFLHEGTQQNMHLLKQRGHILLDPAEGSLASGLEGKGRMMEPEEMVSVVQAYFEPDPKLKDKKILITAGPTYESIDAVRFIGNHSSGKMGFAIAEAAAARGAKVTLVAGPNQLQVQHPLIEYIPVVNSDQMANACFQVFEEMDAAILAAAVADFKPEHTQKGKIKKSDQGLTIGLVPTIDILHTLGTRKKSHQKLVGFALETDNLIENASIKIKKKNLDFIVANSANGENSGFGGDLNTVTLIDADFRSFSHETMSKTKLAQLILNHLCQKL
jgi:phosphopantothenoylcysteine decarboxylase / phosphopantothenate---cysteine ligase